MGQATVAAGLVSGLISYARRRGADAATLMQRAGIAPETLADPDHRLPLSRYLALTHLAQAATGDPALALDFGADIGMAELSIVGLIMEASPTMGAAFAQLQRYGILALELDDGRKAPRFSLVADQSRLFLVDHRADPNQFPELTETSFAWLACGPRRFLDRPHVLGVEVTHPAPSHRARYEQVFNCPVRFGAKWNALELHPGLADWPVAQNPRYVFGVLCERADTLLSRRAAALGTRARLEAELLPLLHLGDVDAGRMADALGYSRSTLFRRLRDEGTTFSAVLDDLRRDMAVRYLRGRKASVNETAYLVGFSDPAAFSRAFKRWMGRTPGRYAAEVTTLPETTPPSSGPPKPVG